MVSSRRGRHLGPLLPLFALAGAVVAAADGPGSKEAGAGDISSVFNSLLAETYEWPQRFADLKAELVPEGAPRRRLLDSWQRLELSLDRELRRIGEQQEASIPVTTLEELHGAAPELQKRIHTAGCVVVRGVVDPAVALGYKQAVREYARNNPNHRGFPPENPQVLELYWSKPQLEARQHPRVHDVLVALSGLWHGANSDNGSERAENQMDPTGADADDAVDLGTVYTYGERLRLRQPGDTSFTLGPHIDGGSIERFEDAHYRKAYETIFDGRWEDYDGWDVGPRVRVNFTRYADPVPNGGCTVFRSFQGWLALSNIGTGPSMGTLQLLPLLKEATAAVLLRPFLPDVGSTSEFCGAVPGRSQELVPQYHGDGLGKGLLNALVPIPAMAPGDMVFWHPDLVHAVQPKHFGAEDSSVFYIPAMPGCDVNRRYVRRQAAAFLTGSTPPDFPPNHSERDFPDRGREEDLTPLGRRMLGLHMVRGDGGGDEELVTHGEL